MKQNISKQLCAFLAVRHLISVKASILSTYTTVQRGLSWQPNRPPACASAME